MERYESLGLVGEGSYGLVLKCRHRDSGRLVAIKKFMDSDDDKTVKKIALREIKLLRQLRHGNLVNLLDVWKRRRRWYLVFEFVERTLLDDLEQNPTGLDLNTSRQHLYQILRAAAFCHQHNIIHRDIKPENILISQGGVVKLCDFGFARTVASPAEDGVYTDYVATRWYRAPELLVGDIKYGKPVDVWAVGCLLLEMLTGQPLFPGDSDLDQIYHIVRCFGNLTAHHQELFYRNPVFSGVRLPECCVRVPLQQRFPTITSPALDLAQSCLQMDPERRAQCSELLEHPLFTQDSFHLRFLNELNAKIQKDYRENSALPKITKTPRREKDEGNEKNPRGRDKKQLEDVDAKVKKEKEKKDKKEEEKMEKVKGKQPSKLSKTIRNTSEPSMSTKQSRTSGAKVMKNKPGKDTGAGLRKEGEIFKPAKTLTSDSLEGSKSVTGLKDSDTVTVKAKYGKAASPEPREGHLKSTKNTKGIDSSGLHSRCSDTAVSEMDACRSSKLKPGEEYGKSKSSVSQTSKVSGSNNKQKNNSSEAESNVKSLKPPVSKCLIGQPQTKLGSLVNHATSTAAVTLRTQKTTEAKRKSDNPERNGTTNMSAITDPTSVPPTATPDHRALKRSFVLHNMDTADLNDFDFTAPPSSPPPPPPPSSTPLLLPPSSTALIPSFSVSPTVGDHLPPGAGFPPGIHSLRCIDKPRNYGGVHSRVAQPALTTAQVSDKSLIGERSFLSDRGGVAVAKKKSDIHLPDLRSSVLPELRGRDGKHNRGVTKDQRKDKQPEAQQHGHNSDDRHHTHTPKHTP
ncbi:cyclin-dependent kinase-like 3 [Toxotes jaculatrix]|uniref:cyclin-dependent kinase-like 3 n=1 Tax=Toxotes jaculatrix TaxID=941984 RepID=UPI001B3AE7E0|nr:cyclin-dependent kinase-like 3 [Toxotes jaculatrix]